MHVIITGGAGFIGSNLAEKMLTMGYTVTIVDNFEPFYPKHIKLQNIAAFYKHPNLYFKEIDILNVADLYTQLTHTYDAIIHLAAKAGVRASIQNPVGFQEINVKGTQNLLEFAKFKQINQFIFASSSSVYGINDKFPWCEEDAVLHPISPYASTKVSCELLGHVYSHLYHIRFIALRFFTVYGPKQRPDLAIHAFSKKIIQQQPIQLFGNGSTERDYTYVSDIVDGILASLHYQKSWYEVINLGNCHTVSLSTMLATLENTLCQKAIVEYLPEQPGDVPKTFANIQKAQQLLNYQPKVAFEEGIQLFKNWLQQTTTA